MANDNERVLNLEKGVNFRELGGYQTTDGRTVKYHKVIRSAGLADLTDHDLNYLKDYGLKIDVDFRSKQEIDKKPDKRPSGVRYVWAPVFQEDETKASEVENESYIPEIGGDPTNGYAHMLQVYRDIITGAPAKAAYRKFFNQLLLNTNDNEALLFHCSAGKDRTGMGTVFFLETLGVPFDTIKQDYLLTNTANKEYVDNLINMLQKKGYTDPDVLNSVRDLMTVHNNYLATAMKTINADYGNIDNYIKKELKVSSSEINTLRKIYLN
ncbi:tyrosine-protein phosphatase [Companilactobacillus crustorum]|uniref:tyrosine-protein phosphatase n=1 Tax=Companilactobacillus crustorum TaxID=392416 RepID=UPI00237E8D93|nr:tyrosine-protein phosphatase [Companilactobacillus crustorum]WDT65735.1 tyrosine-protein phosphatase [Companilactobacillus crustorum]